MAAPRRVLVTGAGGFVGRHMMAALARAFPDAVLLSSGFDLLEPAVIAAGVRDAAPDVVVHLAAVSAVPAARQAPDLAWRVNLDGTRHLAGAVLAHAPACQLLFVSSADVYGRSFAAGVALDETALLAPMNDYAATKAAADLALGAMAADGLRVVRLRPFNHTGPGQSEQFVVASFARQLARIAAGLQAPVLQVGNIDSFRDFLDVRDVCAAYVACIVQRDDLAPGTILNIASGVPRRVSDVLAGLCELAGVRPEISSDATRVRPSEIRTACGDASRARDLLGWAPGIDWTRTLADVMTDWRVRADEA